MEERSSNLFNRMRGRKSRIKSVWFEFDFKFHWELVGLCHSNGYLQLTPPYVELFHQPGYVAASGAGAACVPMKHHAQVVSWVTASLITRFGSVSISMVVFLASLGAGRESVRARAIRELGRGDGSGPHLMYS